MLKNGRRGEKDIRERGAKFGFCKVEGQILEHSIIHVRKYKGCRCSAPVTTQKKTPPEKNVGMSETSREIQDKIRFLDDGRISWSLAGLASMIPSQNPPAENSKPRTYGISAAKPSHHGIQCHPRSVLHCSKPRRAERRDVLNKMLGSQCVEFLHLGSGTTVHKKMIEHINT